MEKFGDIIRHLFLSFVLYLELLFVELAQTVDASANVIVVEEGTRVVIMSELDQKDGVALVGLGSVHSVLLGGGIRGATCVHHLNFA